MCLGLKFWNNILYMTEMSINTTVLVIKCEPPKQHLVHISLGSSILGKITVSDILIRVCQKIKMRITFAIYSEIKKMVLLIINRRCLRHLRFDFQRKNQSKNDF